MKHALKTEAEALMIPDGVSVLVGGFVAPAPQAA